MSSIYPSLQKEFKYRKDFRNETVFTIDPSTARDLDDALHIKPIPDCDGAGNPGWEVNCKSVSVLLVIFVKWKIKIKFQIGVHIADVSHFVQCGTELDQWAFSRGTSVYLVHKVGAFNSSLSLLYFSEFRNPYEVFR